MKYSALLFLSLVLLLFTSSCNEPVVFEEQGRQKIKIGDQSQWAGKDFDDSDWENDVDTDGKEMFWVRLKTFIPKNALPLKNQVILIGATGCYQAYWDGHYLGDNGVLGSADQAEIPGTYLAYFLLPDSLLLEGNHVLALRMTKEVNSIGQHAFFSVGDYFELLRGPLQVSKYMFMLAGAFLISAIYFFFGFAQQRKEYTSLIFAIICLAFCALVLMEFIKLYYLYSYPFQHTRMEIIGGLHVLISIMVPWYFALQFSFPKKKILIGGLVLVTLLLQFKYHYNFDWLAFVHNMLMWFFSLLVVAFAVFEKQKGARTILAGLLSCCLILFLTPYFRMAYVKPFDITIFICFIIIVLSMLYLLTVKQKEDKLAYEESLVLSERLKNELLKKNIRPHFIMNTLTSLIDWVEESPQEGVKFIQSLADEFEVLNQIADYKQIPIGQEIKLCQSHIKVMGFRKEVTYLWEEEGIDPNDIIPPAIIHTIIENGVTHSEPDENGTVTFRLLFEKTKNYKLYRVQTIAKNRVRQKEKISKKREGTGFKYIRARLQESYADQWEMTSNATDNGWETTIKIYH